MSKRSDELRLPTSEELINQGFDFRPKWWQSRVPQPEWSEFLSGLPIADQGRDYRHITRGDILHAFKRDDPNAAVRLLVAAYAWGTGMSAFLVGRRARVFRDNGPERIRTALHGALKVLEGEGPVAAYLSMAVGGRYRLKHLGPSFFTKVLYFADFSEVGFGRALILDRFVAIGMNDLEDWRFPETSPWTAQQYGRWIDYAHAVAAAASSHTGGVVRSDTAELAVFHHGQRVARTGAGVPKDQAVL